MASIAVALENSPEAPSFEYDTLSPDIADEMRERASRILAIQRASVVDVGRHLTAAKKLVVEHGRFVQWVETACQMHIRTAERAMRVAEFVGENDNLSYLPPDGLLALASRSAPKPVVDNLLKKIATGQRLSAAEIKRAIAEARETGTRAREQKPDGAKPQDLGSDPSEQEAATAGLIEMLLTWDRIDEFIAAAKKVDLSKVVEALEKRYEGCGDLVEARREAASTPGCSPGAECPNEIIDAAVANAARATAVEGELEEPSGDALEAQAAPPSSPPDGSDNPDGRVEQSEAASLQGSPKHGTGAAVTSDVATESESLRLVELLTQSEPDPISASHVSKTTAEPLENCKAKDGECGYLLCVAEGRCLAVPIAA
jgi:hypothetical protein